MTLFSKAALALAITVASGSSFSQETQQQQDAVNNYGLCERLIYRSFDGSCNNVFNYRFGATEELLRRYYGGHYIDGISAMVGSEANPSRPNPRLISNTVHSQSADIPSAENLSNFVYQWGQFIDHDLDLDHADDGRPEPVETFIIDQVPGDNFPAFVFERSPYDQSVPNNSARQQVNHISSWLDASMVYGSNLERAAWLRDFEKGRLKVSTIRDANGNIIEEMLPYATTTGELFDSNGNQLPLDPTAPRMEGDTDQNGNRMSGIYIAGDFRANEQTGLTAIHTVWVREHNRIAKKLWNQGYRDDDEIFQRARKIVIGKIQKITYQEWLPALGINLPAYNGYVVNTLPDIGNTFAAAAFRFGHTMLPENIRILNDDETGATIQANGQTFTESVPLIHAFRGTQTVGTYGANIFLKGLAYTTQQEVDPFLVDAIRNFLFLDFSGNALFGNDLASRNIQRGRDHGLRNYANIRAQATGSTVVSFSDINSDTTVAASLASAYDNNINNIDAWVGMISEEHAPGKSVGPTIAAILLEQFTRLRDGDYYYYENDPFIYSGEVDEINNNTFEDVLEANTGMSFEDDVFRNLP